MSGDKKVYRDILHQLILQALFQVMENKVIIRCREADTSLVNDIISDVVKEYKDTMQQDVNAKIDTTYLPANIAGGVEVIALNGRIKVCLNLFDHLIKIIIFINYLLNVQVPNTLESRLDLISEQLIPEIRTALFGANENRKFTD